MVDGASIARGFKICSLFEIVLLHRLIEFLRRKLQL